MTVAGAARSVIRGLGQICFQDNTFCGLVFALALFTAGWRYGVIALLGSAVGTLTAHLLRMSPDPIRQGLTGFSAALAALGVLAILGPGPHTWVLAIAGAAATVGVFAGLGRLLGRIGIPVLTAPFCLVTGLIVALARLGSESAAGSAAPVDQPELSALDLAHGTITGIAQIVLIDRWWTGALLLLALAIASVRVALLALIGSLIGLVAGLVLDLPATELRDGLAGFNPALVMIALGAAFLPSSTATLMYAAAGATGSVLLALALDAPLGALGVPVLTWPFIVITWTMLSLAPRLRRNPVPQTG